MKELEKTAIDSMIEQYNLCSLKDCFSDNVKNHSFLQCGPRETITFRKQLLIVENKSPDFHPITANKSDKYAIREEYLNGEKLDLDKVLEELPTFIEQHKFQSSPYDELKQWKLKNQFLLMLLQTKKFFLTE